MIEDINLALITGVDIPIPNFQTTIHQPTIKEISLIGEKSFFTGAQLICINKKLLEDATAVQIKSNFELFQSILKEQKEKINCVINTLSLLFPQGRVMMTPRSIAIILADDRVIDLNEESFEQFQELVRIILCIHYSEGQDFNPADKRAEEIAKKLLKARQRVAAQKKAEEGESSLGQYVSVVTVGISSMSLNDVINLTIYQLYDLIERYGLYTSWDLDIRSRLAGGTSNKPMENWMKPLHK